MIIFHHNSQYFSFVLVKTAVYREGPDFSAAWLRGVWSCPLLLRLVVPQRKLDKLVGK